MILLLRSQLLADSQLFAPCAHRSRRLTGVVVASAAVALVSHCAADSIVLGLWQNGVGMCASEWKSKILKEECLGGEREVMDGNVVHGREGSFQLVSLTNLGRSPVLCFSRVVRKGFGFGVSVGAQPTGCLSRVLQSCKRLRENTSVSDVGGEVGSPSSLEEDWNRIGIKMWMCLSWIYSLSSKTPKIVNLNCED